MASDETEFSAADLVGSAGSGSNGEKLVNTLLYHYTPELKAAMLKRINPALDEELPEDATEQVAKLVGVDQIEQVHVRGGERRPADAVISYAFFDSNGAVWKGCFPYDDLARGSLTQGRHVSQRESLAASPIGVAYREENPAAAVPEARVESDPFALAEMSAEDLIALMDEHPDRAQFVKDFEKAAHGRNARKTVLEHEVKASN